MQDFIQQIIGYLLLASITDLILPNSSLKKYIKLIFGLLLILLFLQPIFQLFKMSSLLDSNVLLTTLENQYEEIAIEENFINKNNEIQANHNAYILEEVTQQLILVATEQLATKFNVEIIDINYRFALENQFTFETLEEVIVEIKKISEEEVLDIQEININENVEPTDLSDQLTKEIENFLKEVWEIEDKELQVLWKGAVF